MKATCITPGDAVTLSPNEREKDVCVIRFFSADYGGKFKRLNDV